jgi:AraC-like DNA-binding protein
MPAERLTGSKNTASMTQADRPLIRVSATDLEKLLDTLTVSFVALSECLVSAGYVLELSGTPAPGMHYNLAGTGRVIVGNAEPVELRPHTLIIVPPSTPFRIEVHEPGQSGALRKVDGRRQMTLQDGIRRYVAGDGKPEVILICGYFYAQFGPTTDLFGTLSTPIIEQFDSADRIDEKLGRAMTELVAQELGARAMSSALLMEVIVALLRRSLVSMELWTERFALLGDPRIVRAFATMAADPSAPHTLKSVGEAANMSRSALVARFSKLMGKSPMTILRDLRMRRARRLIQGSELSIDQVAREAGYEHRSSFIRTYRKTFGEDPSSLRRAAQQPDPSGE